MFKTTLAVLLCLTGIVGYTHAATYDVYKESGLVATIQLDDPQAVAKLTQILQDPANVNYTIFVYAFGYLGTTVKPITQLAIFKLAAKGICIIINWALEATGGLPGQTVLGFPGAMANAKQIAKKVGQAILSLLAAGVKLIRFILVGFSLGCSLLGEVGRVIQAGGQIIERFLALEPPNYVYNGVTPIDNVGTGCATFVLVLHTNPGQMGTAKSLGHADVWFNYETKPTQPNCSPCDLTTALNVSECCSHNRAPLYFFESVTQGSIMAACSVDGKPGLVITISLDGVPLETRGECFCTTNGESPYGRGTAGLPN